MARIKLDRGLRSQQRVGRRRWFVIIAIVAVVIIAIKGYTLVTGRSNMLDRALTGLTAPVVHVVTRITEGFGSIWSMPSALRENHRLYKENQLLKRRNAELQQLETENERLIRLLKLEVPTGFTPLTATVIARPYDLWLESAIIDAGHADGAQEGNLVVNEDGVVGVVTQVEQAFSRVELISSPQFRLGAISGESRDTGVIRGVDAQTLMLDYLPAGSTISLGEKVFTCGEESYAGGGDDRPRGLFIGWVKGRVSDESGFLEVTVEPAANSNRLGSVVVFAR